MRAQIEPILGNVSTRGSVGTDADALIGGFIISGTAPRKILIRVQGPSIGVAPYNVAEVLDDPTCTLYSGDTAIATNDDWQTDATEANAVRAYQLQPNSARECALVRTLDPGSYTVIVRGKNNITGIALLEIFDVDSKSPASLSRTFNLSTRGRVGTGDKVMILGFIIQGTQPRNVLITTIGGSLGEFNVPNTLNDPKLEIHSGDQIIATCDDWMSSPDFDTIARTGFSPRDPLEPAVYLQLQPGSYTAVVSGVDGAQGVALPEVYDVRSLVDVRFAPTSISDRTAKLVISTGTTAETLDLSFVGATTATVATGANGTYTYTNSDAFRSKITITASGYTLNGTLLFYRNQIAVFDGTLQKPGGSSQAAGGRLIFQ
ncbi:hypothetical protein DB347_02285 [Opitutaceae bacterium EW11]|nr:hypothetical protein DB347_02285 [Opitutaceae bacterium EW11]